MPAEPTTRLDHVLIVGLALGPLAGLVAAIALAWQHGAIGAANLALFFGFWFATLFGIEVGYHRYFSHRAFRTGRVLEALMIVFGSMSFQGPAIWWAATHRQHHKYADRPNDPHSPHLAGGGLGGMLRGLWDAHMGWNFRAYRTIRDKGPWKHLVPDLLDNRWLRGINRGYFVWMALGLILPAALGGAIEHGWHGALTGFLWGGLVRLFAVNHAVYAVNSVCHGFGSRPFAIHSRDRSTNNAALALVTLGGSWHHNHHVFPGSASNWIEPWQIDLGGTILRMLGWCGVVWDLGTPDVRHPEWRRRVRANVSARADQHIHAKAAVSGLTEKSAFLEIGLHAAMFTVGDRVTLADLGGIGELHATIERVTWHGIAVVFDTPVAALALDELSTATPSSSFAQSAAENPSP